MFEDLIGLKLNENELINIVCTRAQANFSNLEEEVYHYLELAPIEKRISQVVSFNSFSKEKIKPHFFSHKHWPTCIIFKLKKGFIEILIQGGFIGGTKKIDAHSTIECCFSRDQDNHQRFPMIDQELFEKGMAELTGLIAESIGKKAV